MTHGEKLKFLQIALAMEGYTITEKTADLIVTTYDQILDKKGKFKLKDAVKVQGEIEHRYTAPPVQQKTEEKPVRQKRKYTRRSAASSKVELPENSLGEWLNRPSTNETLKNLSGKYPAGLPLRMKTILLKRGTQELLRKDLKAVERRDLQSLPRIGKGGWEAFDEARKASV